MSNGSLVAVSVSAGVTPAGVTVKDEVSVSPVPTVSPLWPAKLASAGSPGIAEACVVAVTVPCSAPLQAKAIGSGIFAAVVPLSVTLIVTTGLMILLTTVFVGCWTNWTLV